MSVEVKNGFLSSLQTKLTGKISLAIKYRYKEFFNKVSKGDVFLSVGGDNYCYAGTDILAARNYNLRKKGCCTVLMGMQCRTRSVELSRDKKRY